MKIVYGGYTDAGEFRENNEDRFFVGETDTELPLYVGIVCDGIGGMKNGEVASQAVVDHIAEWCAGIKQIVSFEKVTMSFLDNIYMINTVIAEQSKVNSLETGTTMSAVLIYDGRYMAANVGDSRTYLIDDNIIQITEDDVYPAQGGRRGALRQCVGFGEKMFVNTYYGRFEKNNSFLICSDGFYKEMDGFRILKKFRQLRNARNIEKMLGKEISSLRKNGERDNITACIIRRLV